MPWYGSISIVLVSCGAIMLGYQLFKITELDARSRGFAHPKLWGLFATGQSGGGGLLVYLISRRNHPIKMTSQEQAEMQRRKRHFGWSLAVLTTGGLGLLALAVFGAG